MEIVSSTARKIANSLFDAAGRQVGYLLQYNDNIQALRKQAKKLAGARDRVRGEIDVANRNGEIIEKDVYNWISDVDNITSENEKVLDVDVKANKKCLGGWRFGKKAQQKALEIFQPQEDGKFKIVSRPAPPSGFISSSKGIFEAFEFRKSVINQIMEVLKDKNVSIIGMCGMGGVGSTTLVKEIVKQVEENKLFEQVLMLSVSQTLILTKIQEELASKLGLTLSGNIGVKKSKFTMEYD